MAQAFNTSLKRITWMYAKQLGIKITSTSIQKSVEENPHYPSLLSLSETFKKYNIPNAAYTVTKDNFIKLEPPFVAYVNIAGTGNDFVLVASLSERKVSYYYNNSQLKTMPVEEFLKNYQDVVFVAEPDEKSGEDNFEKKAKSEKTNRFLKIAGITLLTILALLYIISIIINSDKPIALSTILMIKIAALAVSVLFLVYEINSNNAFVKNVCGIGRATNCDAVLNSKASKIAGISWGEIGFFYFAAGTLWLLFPVLNFTEKIMWITVGNVLASPFIIFSIYYQWRVIRQWCFLCLLIQLFLALELLWSIFYGWSAANTWHIMTEHGVLLFCSIGMSISLPVTVWYALKPILHKARNYDPSVAAYKRLQYNEEVFKTILAKQPQAPEGWQDLGIDIGTPDATHIIIKVCNPYCGPCAKAHFEIEKLMSTNENIRLKIIFAIRKQNDVAAHTAANHILMLAENKQPKDMMQVLNDWYSRGNKDYDAFAKKYPMPVQENKFNDQVEKMTAWCEQAEITFTPTIFMNGYRMPEDYSINELRNVLL